MRFPGYRTLRNMANTTIVGLLLIVATVPLLAAGEQYKLDLKRVCSSNDVTLTCKRSPDNTAVLATIWRNTNTESDILEEVATDVSEYSFEMKPELEGHYSCGDDTTTSDSITLLSTYTDSTYFRDILHQNYTR